MMYQTDFRNETTLELTPVLRMLLRMSICRTLLLEDITIPCEISVMLTSNDGIQKLNSQYREKDVPTDVLSFPLYGSISELREDYRENHEADAFALGDVIIAPDIVELEAAALEEPFVKHLCRMCIHSVLHLLGYDHERGEAEEKQMLQKQEAVLETLWKPEN